MPLRPPLPQRPQPPLKKLHRLPVAALVDVLTPSAGESVTEAEVGEWSV